MVNPELDYGMLYRTVRANCALRDLSLAEACGQMGVPLTTLKKMSPRRMDSYPPTTANLVRILHWLGDADLGPYIRVEGEEDGQLRTG